MLFKTADRDNFVALIIFKRNTSVLTVEKNVATMHFLYIFERHYHQRYVLVI